MALAAISATSAYAQKVEAALVDGNPVINCEGMPAGAYTTTSKGNAEATLKTPEANATVYKRFAVSKADNSTSSTWFNAFTVCSGLGAGWRLPTQRELQLIWILHNELKKANGFNPFIANSYWSATEDSSFSDGSWNVSFLNGNTSTSYKNYDIRVRCLREL